MQLRDIPVTPVPDDSNELEEEANWIYRQAFCKPTVSTQVRIFFSYKRLVFINSILVVFCLGL